MLRFVRDNDFLKNFKKVLAFLFAIRYYKQVAAIRRRQNKLISLVGQAVKTLPSHGRISGSIPLRGIDCL